MGRNSSVGMATCYWLNGPGIESRWGRNFPHQSRPALGPIQPPVKWTRVSSPGVKRSGRLVDLPPPSSAEVKERVEMYPYSASGPKSEFNLILIYAWGFKYFYGEHTIKTAVQQTGLTARYTEYSKWNSQNYKNAFFVADSTQTDTRKIVSHNSWLWCVCVCVN